MPDWKKIVSTRTNVAPDLAEEIAQHLEDRYRVLLSAGASEKEACRATLAELADVRPMQSLADPPRPRLT